MKNLRRPSGDTGGNAEKCTHLVDISTSRCLACGRYEIYHGNWWATYHSPRQYWIISGVGAIGAFGILAVTVWGLLVATGIL